MNERAEIMVVQELADETDVFMEFGHLSAATRKKIEEFRRRRKEAEEYIETSPIKPPKAKRTTQDGAEVEEMSSQDKSLRAVQEKDVPSSSKRRLSKEKEMDTLIDPLERLKALESRLQSGRQPTPTKQVEESRRETAMDSTDVESDVKQKDEIKTARQQSLQRRQLKKAIDIYRQ